VLIYDDNKISIEDDTTIAFTEDGAERYAAYGWHVQVVEGGEDVVAIEAALAAARAETGKPSIILLRTIIGYPGPHQDEHRGRRNGSGHVAWQGCRVHRRKRGYAGIARLLLAIRSTKTADDLVAGR
jgi:transketolase